MNKQPYKTFDLPTRHISGSHYIPPRTRNPEEAERRHYLPRGTILLEHQQAGIAMTRDILGSLEQPEDRAFAARVFGASALNASWYSYAQGADVMRRRLALPILADDTMSFRETKAGLREKTEDHLAQLEADAAVAVDHHRAHRLGFREQRRLGRRLGDTALYLGLSTLQTVPQGVSAFEAQQLARDQSLEVLEAARDMVHEIGISPSLAQLPDHDSPLSVYIRREAPDGFFTAFERASAQER